MLVNGSFAIAAIAMYLKLLQSPSGPVFATNVFFFSFCFPVSGSPVSSEVNEYFSGHMLMMHRPTETTASSTRYSEYFAKKTRRWELRLQGASSKQQEQQQQQ